MAPPTSGSLRAAPFACKGACTAVLLTSVLAVRIAAAEEPPPTRLEYRVPEGCPAVAEFERRVHLRSARIRFLGAGSAPRALYVDITASGNASAGTLRLVESDGTDRRRSFQATSCDDAVDGLALIAAVALDPEGASGLAPTPPPPPPPSPPAPPPLANPAPRTLGSEATTPTPIELHVRGGSFGVGGDAISGLVPSAIGGVNVFAQVDFELWRWVAPALRFSATFFGDHRYDVSGGTASFIVEVPRFEVCPLRLGSPEINIRPCVFGSVAIVESTGFNTQRAGIEVHPAWMPGLSAIASARIVGRIDAFGSAGGGVPLNRYEYAFRAHDPSQPNIELYTTNWLVGFVGGGVALGFP